MKYVLLGNLSAGAVRKQKQRVAQARAKLKQLGIKLESVLYTQGPYDFVDVVNAPDAKAALAFSIWYADKGFGRITTLPAFDDAAFAAAVGKAR
jgi:uncharacterized protein with GYD domain